MPTYKLIYFDVKGLGELSRFIFAQSEVRYEDKRVAHSSPISEEWAELKPTTPYTAVYLCWRWTARNLQAVKSSLASSPRGLVWRARTTLRTLISLVSMT